MDHGLIAMGYQKDAIAKHKSITMKIKTTLGALADSIPALSEVAGMAIAGRTAYAIAKTARAVEAETGPFDEARRAIIGRYAGDKGEIKDAEARAKAAAEIAELRDQEVEISIRPVALDELADLTLKPIHLMQLEWMITDGDEPEPEPAAKRKNGRRREKVDA